MLMTARGPYEDPESTTTKWVVIFVLLSLLAHVLIVAAILLITVFMPVPKIVPEQRSPNVTLLLQPEPVPAKAPKPHFMVTTPEPNAPHKPQLIESANDTTLKSKSKTARAPESIMPDVTGNEHAPDLNESPNIPAPPKPEVSSTPPTPRQPNPQKPTPPQPKPQPAKQTPPQPAPKPTPPAPPKKPTPDVDPVTGLPVLPPLNVQTMAQVNPSLASPPPTAPPPMEAESVHGALHPGNDNSPAAMATVLGKYKQKVYRAVGSNWYPKVDKAFQVLGVGMVHVQFTIHSDGTVETKVLDGGNSTMQMLLSISINSIREAAPYDKFEDYPGLREELIKEQGGDGSSYTDDFTFSIYGH
jgi:outer membrane biosynthesis protein TonB